MKRIRLAAILVCLVAFLDGNRGLAAERWATETEMLYVHTDKAFYMPGEIMWFKVYALDGRSRRPLNTSHVAYLEVLGPDNASVLRAKVEMGHDKPNSGSLYIPPGLPTGGYRLVAYTSLMKGQEPERHFTKPITILNPLEPLVAVNAARAGRAYTDGHPGVRAAAGYRLEAVLDKAQVTPRGNVNLSLRAAAGGGLGLSDLSVAVYRLDELQEEPAEDIVDFKPPGSGGAHGAMEYKAHRIAIRYTDKGSLRPLAGKTAWLSIPGKYDRLYVGETDADGVARFHVSNVYGIQELATRLADGQEADVGLLSPFLADHPEIGLGEVRQYDGLENAVLTHSINVQAENAYRRQERERFFRPSIDSIPFYGKADRTYWLDDYTRFVIMEEVLREYVLEVGVRKRSGGFDLRVLDQPNGYFFTSAPLILLDGIPLADANGIMAYDPLKIQRIEIVTGRYFHGPLAYEGIVSFHTYDGMLPGFALDASTTLLNYEGLQYERGFFAPAYDTPEQRGSRMPDMRNLLLWEPNLRLDGNGEAEVAITASDSPGRYVVVVQGLDGEGKPCSGKAYLDVR